MERVRRLEESGVIAGYQARIDPARAGLPLTAFVQMRPGSAAGADPPGSRVTAARARRPAKPVM